MRSSVEIAFAKGARRALLAVLAVSVVTACKTTTEPSPGVPAVLALDPAAIDAGTGAQTIAVLGTRFGPGSQVRVNNQDRLTTFVSSTRLDVALTSADVVNPDTLSFQVLNSSTEESAPFALIVRVPGMVNWTVISAPLTVGAWDVALAPDGSVLAGGFFAGRITRLGAATGSILDTVTTSLWPYDIAVHASSQKAFAAGLDAGAIDVINLNTFDVETSFPQVQRPIRLMTNSAGTTLYTTTLSNFSLYAMSATNGAQIGSPIALGGIGNGLAMVPGADRLWVTTTNGSLRIVNTANWTVQTTILMGGIPQDVVISANGQRAYVANEAGWVGIYDASTGARLDSIRVEAPFGLALSSSDPYLWVASSREGRVFVINTTSRYTISNLAVGGAPRTIVVDAPGRAYIANEDGRVDIATKRP